MSADQVQDTTATEAPAKEAEAKEAAPATAPAAPKIENAAPTDAPELDREAPPQESDSERRRRQRGGVGDVIICRPLEVLVRDDRVEQAIRQLKNRMAREGVLRELKNRRHYYKPSELKRIKSREAARRRRKQARQKTR